MPDRRGRLLNIADASWTLVVGVLCFLGFIVTGFLALVAGALVPEEPERPARINGFESTLGSIM